MPDSRRKGSGFEYEIIQWIEDNFGERPQRVLDQVREADLGDIHFGPFLIECKRYASGTWHRPEWWQQCLSASEKLDRIPVLVYRFDRQPMKFVMRLCDIGDYPVRSNETATMGSREAELVLREKMNSPNELTLSLEDSLSMGERFG